MPRTPEKWQPPWVPREDEPPVHPLIIPSVKMLRGMEGKWEMPSVREVVEGEPTSNPEILVREWISFCGLAIEGGKKVDQSRGEWVGELDMPSIRAWNTVQEALEGKAEKRMRVIEAANRAFISLLHESKMRPWDTYNARKLLRAFEKRAFSYSTI